MSYGKKDEDGDGAILKVDRTVVFQEGNSGKPPEYAGADCKMQLAFSTTLLYHLENAVYYSPRYLCSFSPVNPFRPTRLQTSFLASPNCFKIKILRYGR